MIKSLIADFHRKLHHVAFAYNRVFEKNSPYTETVLKDLAKFCRAHQSTFLPDARSHAVLEGRREVWLKIQEYLQMTPEEIYKLHTIKEIIPKGENGARTSIEN